MEQTYKIHYTTAQSRGYLSIQAHSPALAMIQFYTRSVNKVSLTPPVTAFNDITIVGVTDIQGNKVENDGLW